ncbi:MAG: DUF1428 family protein [Caulobacteraceae bacterium]
MAYVDGFVIAVPKDRLEEYKKIARDFGPKWKALGALSYVECVGDEVPQGELTSFPRAVMAKDDEVVIFSWITYPDKATRDAANARIMDDDTMPSEMPFDMQRMIVGGFETFLEL